MPLEEKEKHLKTTSFWGFHVKLQGCFLWPKILLQISFCNPGLQRKYLLWWNRLAKRFAKYGEGHQIDSLKEWRLSNKKGEVEVVIFFRKK